MGQEASDPTVCPGRSTTPAPGPVTQATASHRLGRGHPEQAESDGQTDPGRFDQPQACLGQGLVDVGGEDRAVVVEAVEARRPAGAPRR